MKKILFVGDSITDTGRIYSVAYNLGGGYPAMVAGSLGLDKPNCYSFKNVGINGNRIVDLLARIKKDMINLSPDYMSVLVGVNDIGHEFCESPNGVDAELFEVYYDIFISQLLKALPNLKIMILEPFLLKGSSTQSIWDRYRSEVEKRADVARRIAEKYNIPFVPLMDKFDNALKQAPAEYWSFDGIHPTYAGHEIIKRAWLEAFNNQLSQEK